MKKHDSSFCLVKCLMLLGIMMSAAISPTAVHASVSRSYDVMAYNIDVVVAADGSAAIEEHLTYDFHGVFNGVLRDIDISGTDGLSGLDVQVIRNGVSIPMSMNAASSLDEPGEPGTYHRVEEGSLIHLKIFEPSTDEQKIFVIRYNLLNVVNVYRDTAAFNRKLIDAGWTVNLHEIRIGITLPAGADKQEIRIFGHGPLEGESRIVDASHVTLYSPFSAPGSFVETLVLFPTRLVPQASRREDREALPGMLANEAQLAKDANAIREAAKAQEAARQQQELAAGERLVQRAAIGTGLAIVMILLWGVVAVYLYIKYDRERRPAFKGQYCRELPGEYTPAEMDVLMSGGAKTRDIMATLMDLVRKRQVHLVSHDELKPGFFGSKTITGHAFVQNAEAPVIPLRQHESFLLGWFLSGIGDGMSVTLQEIRDFGKDRGHALQFKSDYDNWVRLVKMEADKNQFYDLTVKKAVGLGVLAGVAWFGLGLFLALTLSGSLSILPPLLGVVLIIYAAGIKKRTAYGNEQYVMWEAFRRFLKDFSHLDRAVIPSIVIWEHYLVYAISLGVATEVIRQLPLVFRDEDLNDSRLTYLHGARYGYFAGFATTFHQTMQSVESAVSTASSLANSASSSASGSGGGFSGGSSGGGGGGGGGGAF